jgi:hypothetical protein
MMTTNQTAEIQKIRANYEAKQRTKLEELKDLDKRVTTPATVFAYIFGSIGALVLGLGMCLAMQVIGNSMALGIVIGLFGIAWVSVTYPTYKAMLKARRNKYSKQIFELSDSLLNA